jgi:hypothetical protein
MQAGIEGRRRVQWYHPGEVVIVARVPRQRAADSGSLHAEVRGLLGEQARGLIAGPETTRSFAFDAPGEDRSLAFLFHRLADADSPRAVKDAVETLHQQLGGAARGDVEVIAAMPHVHTRAHEDFSGASPGSLPRPVYPDQVPAGWTGRFYQPVNPRLDLTQEAEKALPVRVAVLDTMPDLERARLRAERLNNQQLRHTVETLQRHGQADPRYTAEQAELERHHAGERSFAASEPRPYPVPDHGLFVAGLVQGVAPRADLTLEPVLDDMGVGDLSVLLLGLQRVLERKQPREPQIVNLSLGFLPHPARLPAAWFGLQRPHDQGYLHASDLFDPARDRRWVAANRSEVARTVDLLEIGLRELGRYLSLNNCLVVAAAGNDSLDEVVAHQARMEPRLPARFDTVLGVAATTSDPRQPARYSNVGDERELGDHVATFGGNASENLEPEDGVIGLYSGEFPERRPNETGWAFWSGTSFATAIVSGIAANYWATHRDLHASEVLADLHDEASAHGPYVAALRTPSIEVRGRWGRNGSG